MRHDIASRHLSQAECRPPGLGVERGPESCRPRSGCSPAARVSQNGAGVLMERVGVAGALGYGGYAHRLERLDAAQHVEYGSASLPVVEPKVVLSRARQQTRATEFLQLRDLHMIGGDVVSSVPLTRREARAVRIVGAVGEADEGLVRVGGAAHTQVDLKRERLPAAVFAT